MDNLLIAILTSSFLASLPAFVYGVIRDRRSAKQAASLAPEQRKNLLQEANDLAIAAFRSIDRDRVEDIKRLRERIVELEIEVNMLRSKLRKAEDDIDIRDDKIRRLNQELVTTRIEVSELSEALRQYGQNS